MTGYFYLDMIVVIVAVMGFFYGLYYHFTHKFRLYSLLGGLTFPPLVGWIIYGESYQRQMGALFTTGILFLLLAISSWLKIEISPSVIAHNDPSSTPESPLITRLDWVQSILFTLAFAAALILGITLEAPPM